MFTIYRNLINQNYLPMRLFFKVLLISFFFGQLKTEAQSAPVISYSTPNTYTKDETISPLKPANTGGIVSGSEVTTFAGSGSIGEDDGIGKSSNFSFPRGIAIDAEGYLYVTDLGGHKIRKINTAGVVTTIAGSGIIGDMDGAGIVASFNRPNGIVVDVVGNCYISDMFNHKIRKINKEGVVTTLAGMGFPFFADGIGKAAGFEQPQGLAVDDLGNVYVADLFNRRIRKITTAGVVTTFAGSGKTGAGSVDGTGITASFDFPVGVALDSKDNLYVTDATANKIRKITPLGVVTTYAGNGVKGADDGIANIASFNRPSGIAIDNLDNVYIADRNSKIRKISSDGVVTTIAGNGTVGDNDGLGTIASFSGDEGLGLAVDRSGNLYVADSGNNKIRKITIINGTYNISPTLPAGLLFNTSTGEITGTATSIAPTQSYTVTATNNFGSSTFDITITINAPIDTDSDGVDDISDNCPKLYNPEQADRNKDGIGDVCDDLADLQISEAITPNGDNINDTWIIYNSEKHQGGVNVRVFNRWGSEVFYSGDYKNDWDGSGLPESAYYYKVILNGDSSKEIKGWLYITK